MTGYLSLALVVIAVTAGLFLRAANRRRAAPPPRQDIPRARSERPACE